jgi:hypothetical protein
MSNPKGFSFNNPLNIKKTADRWRGQLIPHEDDVFARFESPEYGIRAAAKLMQTYWSKYGIDTIEELVERWAPPSDNNPTANYVAFVANKANRETDVPYDVFSYADMLPILQAMTRFELGKPPGAEWYPEEVFERGLRLAGVVKKKPLNPTKSNGSRTMKGATTSTAGAVAALAILFEALELPPEILELLPTFLADMSDKALAGIAIGAVIAANLWVKWSRYDDSKNDRI